MRRLLRFLDTLDSGLRWALFIPAGVGLSFLVLGLVDAGFAMASGRYRTVPGVFENSVDAFIGDFTRGLFPAVISPRPWLVAIIMFTLDVLLRAGPFAYMLFSNEYMRPRAPRIVTVVAAGFVGGCLALYLVRRVAKSMR